LTIERREEIFPANTVIDSYVTPLPPHLFLRKLSLSRAKAKSSLDE